MARTSYASGDQTRHIGGHPRRRRGSRRWAPRRDLRSSDCYSSVPVLARLALHPI
jgi:hypothetical protein